MVLFLVVLIVIAFVAAKFARKVIDTLSKHTKMFEKMNNTLEKSTTDSNNTRIIVDMHTKQLDDHQKILDNHCKILESNV